MTFKAGREFPKAEKSEEETEHAENQGDAGIGIGFRLRQRKQFERLDQEKEEQMGEKKERRERRPGIKPFGVRARNGARIAPRLLWAAAPAAALPLARAVFELPHRALHPWLRFWPSLALNCLAYDDRAYKCLRCAGRGSGGSGGSGRRFLLLRRGLFDIYPGAHPIPRSTLRLAAEVLPPDEAAESSKA